jgi:hypothetical protein
MFMLSFVLVIMCCLFERELICGSLIMKRTFLAGFVLPDLQFYMYALQIVVSPFVYFSFGHCASEINSDY